AGQPVAGFAFAPEGRSLAAASASPDKPVVRVWDLATGVGKDLLQRDPGAQGTRRYQGVAFTPDGRQLFVAAYETLPGRQPQRTDCFYGPDTGRQTRALSAYRSEHRVKARLSPDGRRVAYFTKDGTVRVWDAENDREAAVLAGHAATVSEVAF